MNTKVLIGGLLAGAAVGVAIGMLVSPEFRETVKKGVRKVTDSSFGDAVKEGYNEHVDEVANKGKELIDSGSRKVKV